MPASTLGDQRWTRSGENSAGDAVYSRTIGESGRDYSEMTKEELQGLLRHMGLAVSGTKDELIARLQDAE